MLINQYVLRFDVPVDHPIFVNFVNSCEHLRQKLNCRCFIQVIKLVQNLSQVSPRTVITHQVEVVERLKRIVQLAYEWMRNLALHFLFCYHKFDQTIVSFLLHSFKRKVLVTPEMLDQENLSVATLTQDTHSSKVTCGDCACTCE